MPREKRRNKREINLFVPSLAQTSKLNLFWTWRDVHQKPENNYWSSACVTKRGTGNESSSFYQLIESEKEKNKWKLDQHRHHQHVKCFRWISTETSFKVLFRLLRTFNLCLHITKCHLKLQIQTSCLFFAFRFVHGTVRALMNQRKSINEKHVKTFLLTQFRRKFSS